MSFGSHLLRAEENSDPLTRKKSRSRYNSSTLARVAAQTVVERVRVPLRRLPEALEGLVLAQLSDIHLGPHTTRLDVRSIVARTNELEPDLVVLTGDYVHSPARFADAQCSIEECARELSYLSAPLGVYAVLGNHDALMNGRANGSTADLASEVLGAFGIPVLENVAVPVYHNRCRFWLVGVEDLIMCRPDIELALHGTDASEPRILLCHEPDFAREASNYSVDLQLSGHSHGGQIVLPGIGPLKLPYGARSFAGGLTQVRSMKLYTTRGIGYSQLPVRLNCPPEITLLTLRREETHPGISGTASGVLSRTN